MRRLEKRHFIKTPILNSIFHFTFFFSCVTLGKEIPTRAESFQFYSKETFIFSFKCNKTLNTEKAVVPKDFLLDLMLPNA